MNPAADCDVNISDSPALPTNSFPISTFAKELKPTPAVFGRKLRRLFGTTMALDAIEGDIQEVAVGGQNSGATINSETVYWVTLTGGRVEDATNMVMAAYQHEDQQIVCYPGELMNKYIFPDDGNLLEAIERQFLVHTEIDRQACRITFSGRLAWDVDEARKAIEEMIAVFLGNLSSRTPELGAKAIERRVLLRHILVAAMKVKIPFDHFRDLPQPTLRVILRWLRWVGNDADIPDAELIGEMKSDDMPVGNGCTAALGTEMANDGDCGHDDGWKLEHADADVVKSSTEDGDVVVDEEGSSDHDGSVMFVEEVVANARNIISKLQKGAVEPAAKVVNQDDDDIALISFDDEPIIVAGRQSASEAGIKADLANGSNNSCLYFNSKSDPLFYIDTDGEMVSVSTPNAAGASLTNTTPANVNNSGGSNSSSGSSKRALSVSPSSGNKQSSAGGSAGVKNKRISPECIFESQNLTKDCDLPSTSGARAPVRNLTANVLLDASGEDDIQHVATVSGNSGRQNCAAAAAKGSKAAVGGARSKRTGLMGAQPGSTAEPDVLFDGMYSSNSAPSFIPVSSGKQGVDTVRTGVSSISIGGGSVKRRGVPLGLDKLAMRPIVVDGLNVGYQHGQNEIFNDNGLLLVVQKFKYELGCQDIRIVIPRSISMRGRSGQLNQVGNLDKLEEMKYICRSPSRRLYDSYGRPGVRQSVHDDEFIIKLAYACGGVIVSNDQFRDYLVGHPEWEDLIHHRLISYMIRGNSFIISDYPLGPDGPRLEEIIRFGPGEQPTEEASLGNILEQLQRDAGIASNSNGGGGVSGNWGGGWNAETRSTFDGNGGGGPQPYVPPDRPFLIAERPFGNLDANPTHQHQSRQLDRQPPRLTGANQVPMTNSRFASNRSTSRNRSNNSRFAPNRSTSRRRSASTNRSISSDRKRNSSHGARRGVNGHVGGMRNNAHGGWSRLSNNGGFQRSGRSMNRGGYNNRNNFDVNNPPPPVFNEFIPVVQMGRDFVPPPKASPSYVSLDEIGDTGQHRQSNSLLEPKLHSDTLPHSAMKAPGMGVVHDRTQNPNNDQTDNLLDLGEPSPVSLPDPESLLLFPVKSELPKKLLSTGALAGGDGAVAAGSNGHVTSAVKREFTVGKTESDRDLLGELNAYFGFGEGDEGFFEDRAHKTEPIFSAPKHDGSVQDGGLVAAGATDEARMMDGFKFQPPVPRQQALFSTTATASAFQGTEGTNQAVSTNANSTNVRQPSPSGGPPDPVHSGTRTQKETMDMERNLTEILPNNINEIRLVLADPSFAAMRNLNTITERVLYVISTVENERRKEEERLGVSGNEWAPTTSSSRRRLNRHRSGAADGIRGLGGGVDDGWEDD